VEGAGLDPIDLVGAPGFEPGTSCSQSRRATGLRHTPLPSQLSHRRVAPAILTADGVATKSRCVKPQPCGLLISVGGSIVGLIHGDLIPVVIERFQVARIDNTVGDPDRR
jgi:hypothetical protein